MVSENTERSLANLIPWKAGMSPNPGGRPKGVVALVREQTRDGAELVDFMVRVMRSKRHPLRYRLEAVAWLADRGFGKALQQMELSGPGAEPLVIRVEYPDPDLHGDPA